MNKCFNCDSIANAQIYGTPICNLCKSDLRLFTTDTINRQKMEYKSSKKYATYQDEISDRLLTLKRDYLKKNIKLLHILEQLAKLNEYKPLTACVSDGEQRTDYGILCF